MESFEDNEVTNLKAEKKEEVQNVKYDEYSSDYPSFGFVLKRTFVPLGLVAGLIAGYCYSQRKRESPQKEGGYEDNYIRYVGEETTD